MCSFPLSNKYVSGHTGMPALQQGSNAVLKRNEARLLQENFGRALTRNTVYGD